MQKMVLRYKYFWPTVKLNIVHNSKPCRLFYLAYLLSQGDSSGLDVAQIVITAATPMTDDHVPLPGEPKKSAEGNDDTNDGVETTEQPGNVDNTETSATEAEACSPINDTTQDQKSPPSDPVPEEAATPPFVQVQKEESPEDEEEGEGECSQWAAFEDNFPKVPLSAVPRVVEVEVKESAKIEPKKSSLDIDDKEKSRISLGESNESPVTPEELDVQNLAKLESLKESDA